MTFGYASAEGRVDPEHTKFQLTLFNVTGDSSRHKMNESFSKIIYIRYNSNIIHGTKMRQ